VAGTDKSRARALGGPAVILVEPQLGQNIGTTARAMLNFGLGDLRLVRPREPWPNVDAVAASSGATVVLDNARVFADTRAAIADLNRVYATTARPRGMVKVVLSPREAAAEIRDLEAADAKAGVLFGPERSGLVNDDVALADAVITADLNPSFSSLNLAMAVMLMAYEWYRQGTQGRDRRLTQGKRPLARKEDLLDFLSRLETELATRRFFPTPELRPYMVRSLHNIFGRASLTDQEVRTLHGVVSALMRPPKEAPPETSEARDTGAGGANETGAGD